MHGDIHYIIITDSEAILIKVISIVVVRCRVRDIHDSTTLWHWRPTCYGTGSAVYIIKVAAGSALYIGDLRVRWMLGHLRL